MKEQSINIYREWRSKHPTWPNTRNVARILQLKFLLEDGIKFTITLKNSKHQ